jgi:hypothetical protein
MRRVMREAVNCLTSKPEHLRYDTALERGWPIAAGIIEGACRHLVKDRLDITGARWGLSGAEAVLKLRAVRANGDFDAYWTWHEQRDPPQPPGALPRPAHTHRLIDSTLIGSAPFRVYRLSGAGLHLAPCQLSRRPAAAGPSTGKWHWCVSGTTWWGGCARSGPGSRTSSDLSG